MPKIIGTNKLIPPDINQSLSFNGTVPKIGIIKGKYITPRSRINELITARTR
jgi:hypothetical protein